MRRCPACSRENPDDARFCNACGGPLSAERDERRKVATLLFCDVANSTALGERVDSEAVRGLMLAYFDEMRGAIESHGGTVEKFIGDAVVGVFGVPVAHEDDALRAARAASEMRRRLETLNEDLERSYGTRLSIRIGLNTGEIVAGDSRGRQGFVSGDAVNVAARLEQAAPAGDVLLGETTFALVEPFVHAEAVPAVTVKGKGAALRAYRLLEVKPDGAVQARSASPFVGRDGELAALLGWIERVSGSGRPERMLVVGEAGVGKSRLVDAALDRADVSVLSVRCLPYGEDITYLPVVHLVRQAAGIGGGEEPGAMRDRICEAFRGAPDAETATAVLAQVFGLVAGAASGDEIAWAVRRFLESLAAVRPLLLLVDDLQWAQEPFVDLLAAVAERASGPIAVLGLARPEFAANRPGWPVGLRLSPLGDDEAVELIRRLLPGASPAPESRRRLLDAAGGNPLFLTELIAYVGAEGESSEVPPTLEALLNARLDARPPDERRTLECAAVEGQVFHRGALVALAAPTGGATVDSSLGGLLEDALIRPARSTFDEELAFQFHHLLVRDAAYRGTAKRRRADLHLRFAAWLEAKFGARVAEVAEIVGYHLEQAWRLRGELGPRDGETLAVGERAAALLGGAARRSLARGDARAALGLFTRAATLAPPGPARIEAELGRGSAASEVGEFALAEDLLRAVEAAASEAGLEVTAARARLELAMLEQSLRPHRASRLKPVAESALTTFAAHADEEGRAYVFWVLARERWVALRLAEAEELLEQALVHAEAARDDRLTASILTALARAVLLGPTPTDEAAERCEELLARGRRIGPATEATIRNKLGVLEATRGHADRARELLATSIAVLQETALPLPAAAASQYGGMAELALGEPGRAERHFRSAFEALDRLGERSVASSVAAQLSRTLVDLSRDDEAEQLAVLALEWSGGGDVATRSYAQSALALVFARRGDADGARSAAATAVRLAGATDFSNLRGDTLLDHAVVLRACGDETGAQLAAAAARDCFLAKGNRPAAARAAVLAAH